MYEWLFTKTEASTASPIPIPNTAWMLFLLPRLTQFVWSIVGDVMLYKSCVNFFSFSNGNDRKQETSLPWTILAWNSFTFPSLVLMTRTFSNSLESIILMAMIYLASRVHAATKLHSTSSSSNSDSDKDKDRSSIILEQHLCWILFGLLVGFGSCVRLSILFWGGPLGIYFILKRYSFQMQMRGLQRRRAESERPNWITKMKILVSSGLQVSSFVFIPCLCVVFILCLIDSFYYESLRLCFDTSTLSSTSASTSTSSSTWECSKGLQSSLHLLWTHVLLQSTGMRIPSMSIAGAFLFTPYTNFLYNSLPENVAHHGHHFKGTHVTINILLLFGPGIYVRFMQKTGRMICAMWTRVRTRTQTNRTRTLPTPPTDDNSSSVSSAKASAAAARTKKPLLVQPHQTAPSDNPASELSQVLLHDDDPSSSSVDTLLLCCLWSGLLCLSSVPHQEFRFLLPMAYPLAIVCRPKIGLSNEENEPSSSSSFFSSSSSSSKTSSAVTKEGSTIPVPSSSSSSSSSSSLPRSTFTRVLKILSRIHLLAVITVLGVLHQGGLLSHWTDASFFRSLMQPPQQTDSSHSSISSSPPSSSSSSAPSFSFIYMNTYTTPTAFIHAQAQEFNVSVLSIIDVHHASLLPKALIKSIEPSSAAATPSPSSPVPTSSSHRVVLIMPGSVPFPLQMIREASNMIRTRMRKQDRASEDDGSGSDSSTSSSPSIQSLDEMLNIISQEVDHDSQQPGLCITPLPLPSSSIHGLLPHIHLTLDDAPRIPNEGSAAKVHEYMLEALDRTASSSPSSSSQSSPLHDLISQLTLRAFEVQILNPSSSGSSSSSSARCPKNCFI